MKNLTLAACVCAAMCAVTVGTVSMDFAASASAATAAVATVDVYKDAN